MVQGPKRKSSHNVIEVGTTEAQAAGAAREQHTEPERKPASCCSVSLAPSTDRAYHCASGNEQAYLRARLHFCRAGIEGLIISKR